MNSRAEAPKPRASPYLVVVAVAPLVLATLFLQLIGSPANPLSSEEFALLRERLIWQAFVPGEIVYVAVLVVNFCVSIVAIWVARDMLRSPRAAPYKGVAALVTLALVIAFPAMAWMDGITLYQLSYHGIVAAFRGMGAGATFAGTGPGATPLATTMLLSTCVGTAATAAASAAANFQLEQFPPAIGKTGEARAAYVVRIYGRLRRCLYALSLVLVTGTISASLFFHLITGFAVPPKTDEAALLARLSEYASELSILWGCIYTLTLVAAVGLPMLLFQQRVSKNLEELSADAYAAEECKRLTDAGILSGGGEQLKFLATFLAPLAAGPIANFAQATTVFSS